MSKILKVVGASWLQTKISSYILGFLGTVSILALFIGQMERTKEDGNYAATVFYSKTGYRIEYWGQSNNLLEIPQGVARAYFRRDIDTAGWSLLDVETNGSYADEIQAYAAGILEGALTWNLIHTHLKNTIHAKCESRQMDKQCDKLRDALDQSVNKWKTYADDQAHADPFWHHVSLHYTQISGVFTGWKHGVERSLNEYETDISDLYWLNSVSEVAEIQHKLNISIENSTLDSLPSLSSAFVRIANETNEKETWTKKLYLAQNAAGSYASMTRILKRYKFNFHLTSKDPTPAPSNTVDFSGYPGSITSQDDFYLLKGKQYKIAVSGTTLRNYNVKLWKDVNITTQVPIGPRITAANHLSTNVSSWGRTLAASNSGTACKQWLVLDFTKFDTLHDPTAHGAEVKQGNDIVTEINVVKDVKHTVVHRAASTGRAKGLAWLIEQVPGRTHSADISDALLEQGYWAVFGLPFFKDIAEITYVTKMEELYGKVFSESESPRAIIFKRGYKNATSLDTIVELMRQNNVTAMNRANNDTLDCSEDVDCALAEDGYWSVAGARGDVVIKHKEPFGVIDTKVVSGTVKQPSLDFIAISSPPFTKVPNVTETKLLNKGNIASVYTDQFDNQQNIDGDHIRDLVKQQREEAEQETLELLYRDVVRPFQWTESDFKDRIHENLPDKWNFDQYKPTWAW